MRLAIITTHPIQYYAPWFRLLAKRNIVFPKIFYTWEQSSTGVKFDPGFGKKIEWDIPLLEGYEYTFVKNTASEPGSHHFNGIINPTLISELKQWNPNAILIIGWNFQSHLKCMRYFHNKIPVFFRGDSTLLDEQNLLKKAFRRVFLKWIYHYVDYALYVGSNNKKYFLARGLKERQLIFAPHAIDNERFAEPAGIYEREAILWRSEIGIQDDDIAILFAGKLEPKKNPSLLLELAKSCTDKRLKFILVGNGVLEEELKSSAFNDERIKFINFQNQQRMPVVYRLGDVFILPSKGPGETWGLAVNEAMACNRPVIISDKVGCSIDLVKNGINGIIFDITSPGSIISFVKQLLQEDVLIKKMGNQSAQIVKGFSFQQIVNAIEQLMIQPVI
jgi:glycosyltransferase involved in cell wall biosynthesis